MQKFFEKHERLICLLAPAIIGVIYIILCAVNLQQSIWFDESYGAYLTRFDFGDIWRFTSVDVHPPLYYFLLKIWSGIFGYTDFAMRFMSILFGAIAIVFAWAWIKRKFGVKPALLATLLMALSPMLIRYGQEMRMYTLAAAFIFSATFILQLAIDTKKRRWWIIYGILLSLGMWTHYFVALIWIAHLAYLIYTYRKKIFQKNIIIAYAVAIILYLPWLPTFLSQSSTVQNGFWIPETSVTSLTDYFTNSFLFLNSSDVTGWLLVLMLIVAITFITITIRAKKKLTLLNFMAFLPPLLLVFLSVPPLKPMFVDRYVIYSSISMSLIAGVAIMLPSGKKQPKNQPRLKRLAPALTAIIFIGASITGITNVYSLSHHNKADAKTLYENVTALASEGEPIIAYNELVYYDLVFYSTPEHPVYFLDETSTYPWGAHEPLKTKDYGKITDLDTFLKNHEKIWYVGDSPETGNLQFVRNNWRQITEIILPINTNQSDYQAIEFQKTE